MEVWEICREFYSSLTLCVTEVDVIYCTRLKANQKGTVSELAIAI